MNITEYAQAVKWTGVYETKQLWYQCVALVKDAINKVYKIKLWVFWGTAMTGWKNIKNTFPKEKWDRITNDINSPDQVPVPWDVIFFSTPRVENHTAIVLKAEKWVNLITVLEQNVWNWDWKGNDDKIEINKYKYRNVLWWYHLKWNFTEFGWVRVRHSDSLTSDGAVATYHKDFKTITIASNYFNLDYNTQVWVMEHEHAHKVYYDIPMAIRWIWKSMHLFDSKILKRLWAFGYVFEKNEYVNWYAMKNEREDFSECVRLRNEKFIWKYVNFKIRVANYLYNKYK